MATTKMMESCRLMAKAITNPPMQERGARTSMHSTERSMFCIWVTSLVKRVMREEVLKRSISRKEKVWMLSNIPLRSAAPKRMAATEEVAVQPTPPKMPMKATEIMMPPVRQTSAMSPLATPTSMIWDISVGCIRSQSTSTTISRGAATTKIQVVPWIYLDSLLIIVSLLLFRL